MKKDFEIETDKLALELVNGNTVEDLGNWILKSKKFVNTLSNEEAAIFLDTCKETLKTKCAHITAEEILKEEDAPFEKFAMEKVQAYVSEAEKVFIDSAAPEEADSEKLSFISHLLQCAKSAMESNETAVVPMYCELLSAYEKNDSCGIALVRRHFLSDLQEYVLEQGEQLYPDSKDIANWRHFEELFHIAEGEDPKNVFAMISFDEDAQEFRKKEKAESAPF